jgi:hypothetical protein
MYTVMRPLYTFQGGVAERLRFDPRLLAKLIRIEPFDDHEVHRSYLRAFLARGLIVSRMVTLNGCVVAGKLDDGIASSGYPLWHLVAPTSSKKPTAKLLDTLWR